MSKHFLILFMIALFFIGSAPPSRALEPLHYAEKASPSLTHQLNIFLEKTYETDISHYHIAQNDLNNDGIDEYILRLKNCEARARHCTHLILAETQDKIMELAKIKARTLMIASTFSHGIQDVLAFENAVNDYNFNIYMWSPSQKIYILKDEYVEN